jgi:exodeoxyribonuclease VII large subunit
MVAGLLERSLPLVWVSGEISNMTRAASGHWYFTLKDRSAQIRAVMFRGRAQYTGFVPREGDQVEVRALAGLYEPRGDFQLNVDTMRRAGAGDLYQRFLKLKAQLDGEGLFDPSRKRPLPRHPARIGVITSLQAAALQDVLTTLARRVPHIPVVIYPSPVQGSEAPAALIAALMRAGERHECDLLLLVRGGGSIEDLWAFNDERLARAIAASPIPVLTGVGHETDFTIADFVADVRAPTPTAAAEQAAIDRQTLVAEWVERVWALDRNMQRLLDRADQRLDWAVRLLRPPSAQWRERAHQLEQFAARLRSAKRARLERTRLGLIRAESRLRPPRIDASARLLEGLTRRLATALSRRLAAQDARTLRLTGALELVSPLAVLERGYAIVRDQAGQLRRDATGLKPGDGLRIQLAQDAIDARVERIAPEPRDP